MFFLRFLLIGLFVLSGLFGPLSLAGAAERGDGASAPLTAKEASGAVLPRFAVLKSDNTYVRTGPSMDYPIRWIYKRADLPVEIVHEYDSWRKIRDQDGSVGWVHRILLSGQRTVLVSGSAFATAWDSPLGNHAVAKLSPGVIAKVTECNKDLCLLDFPPYEGWVEKKFLWGVYPSEILN